jgi:predicted negative regulator of RcsB-dependent stress response
MNHPIPPPSKCDPRVQAEALKEKEKGNVLFRQGDTAAAVRQYDASLALARTTAAHLNRSAALLKLGACPPALL